MLSASQARSRWHSPRIAGWNCFDPGGDPVSGAFSQMIGALSYGASRQISCFCCKWRSRQLPVGPLPPMSSACGPVTADGITPCGRGDAYLERDQRLAFSVCTEVLLFGAERRSGESSSWVTPTATDRARSAIALAPASYSPPQSSRPRW